MFSYSSLTFQYMSQQCIKLVLMIHLLTQPHDLVHQISRLSNSVQDTFVKFYGKLKFKNLVSDVTLEFLHLKL